MEIWLQQDHPIVGPIAYVRPTPDMYVATNSRDVQPDGVVIIPYLRTWRHVNHFDLIFFSFSPSFQPLCDLANLINAMSEAFSQSPPVYAAPSGSVRPAASTAYSNNPTPYPSNPSVYPVIATPYPNSSTPYPVTSSMPMPPTGSSSYPYPQEYAQPAIPQSVYRDSVQTAALDRVRYRLDEAIQLGNAQIDSMRKAEEDLLNGEKKIQSMINDAQQQQIQAQVSLSLSLFATSLSFYSFLFSRIISSIYVQN